MHRFEKPQKGNPHRLTINQHIFPAKSIARFAGADGRVHVWQRATLVRRAKPNDALFCGQRVWDHGSEVGFIKGIEDRFQQLADLIISDSVSSFDQEQTHVISSFYVLWMARAHLRERPAQDAVLHGVIPGPHKWSKDEEEQLEKADVAFQRGNTVPGYLVNGMHVRILVGRFLRQVNPTAQWRIVRAAGGEFVVPDWPVHGFVPITPTLGLVNSPADEMLGRDAVRVVNDQLRSVSRRYFFARDFGACP